METRPTQVQSHDRLLLTRLSRVPIWQPIEEPIRSYISICTWFTRSKMGNVLAASPTNPSSSSNVTTIPPPPPLTAPPPIEEKQPLVAKKGAENNPGTYEELHKACKGRFHNRLLGFFCVQVVIPVDCLIFWLREIHIG